MERAVEPLRPPNGALRVRVVLRSPRLRLQFHVTAAALPLAGEEPYLEPIEPVDGSGHDRNELIRTPFVVARVDQA